MARASRSTSRTASPMATAHEEGLRQLEALAGYVQEIAIVEGLQAEIVELQVALRLQRGGEPCDVEAAEFGVDQLAAMPRVR